MYVYSLVGGCSLSHRRTEPRRERRAYTGGETAFIQVTKSKGERRLSQCSKQQELVSSN